MTRQKLTHAYYAFASYLRREGHLYEVFLVLAKTRLILDKMCRLYGKFASYLRRVLCKTRLIFPRINGPIVHVQHTRLQQVSVTNHVCLGQETGCCDTKTWGQVITTISFRHERNSLCVHQRNFIDIFALFHLKNLPNKFKPL